MVAMTELAPGDVVAHRYRIERLLARGGMGVVYIAEHLETEQRVALKVLLPDVSTSAEAMDRFRLEARVFARLASDHIVRVVDAGVDETRHVAYIAMDLLEGETLHVMVERRGPLDGDSVATLLAQTATALDRAHAYVDKDGTLRPIVHRDLKPENIFVTKSENGALYVKVLDFGIAKIASATAQASTELRGTPQYMAFEQVEGEEVTPRTDVAALGLIAFYCSTGKSYWKTANDPGALLVTVVREILGGTSVGASARAKELGVARELSPAFDDWFARCTARVPAERFASAGAAARALGSALGAAPHASTLRAERAAPSARSPERPRVAIVAGVVVAIAAAAFAAAKWSHAPEAPATLSSTASSREPSSSAAPRVTRTIDLPLPASDNPAAITAYKEGVQAHRDGASATMLTSFTRAATLDPTMGAAWLRLLAMFPPQGPPSEARELYRKAAQNRARLDQRDAQLLDALEPTVLRDPPDFAESAARMAKLAELYPRDVGILTSLWRTQLFALDYEGSRASADRALALDPASANLWAAKGFAIVQLGDVRGAEEAWAHGLRVFSGCTNCNDGPAWLAVTAGDCARVEDLGRQIIRTEPQSADGYFDFAWGLADQGRARALVLEALNQAFARLPDLSRGVARATGLLKLEVLYGDFAAADRAAGDLERRIASGSDEMDHAELALARIGLAEEAGQSARAAEIAKDFLARRDAWTPYPIFDELPLVFDPVPRLLAIEARVALVTKAASRDGRTRWIEAWRAKMHAKKSGYLWLYAYAVPAVTSDDARAALDARDSFPPLPLPVKFTWVAPVYEAHVGKTLLLAGRAAEAIEPLARSAASCDGLMYPFEKVRAHLWLGQAREATGDTTGACAAYARVVSQWGAAMTRSVTARTARDRAAALRCAP